MRETRGDLWALAEATPGAWVVVPTNGALRGDGSLVMGAGVAGAAARRHSGLGGALGAHVRASGNVPAAVTWARVLSWPTKPAIHDVDGSPHPGWMCVARVRAHACERMVAQLTWSNAPLVVAAADHAQVTGPIFLPHVGCGLGGLDWAKVGPELGRVLDDRFIAVAPR